MEAAHLTKTVIEKNGFAVKIYPMTRGGFTICYKGPQGRVRETVANFPRAVGRAKAVVSQLCAARGDMLSLSIQQIAEYRAALARLNGASITAAVDAYLKHTEAAGALSPIVPLLEQVDHFLDCKRRTGISERHYQTLRQHLHKFADWFRGTGLSRISVPDLDRYLHAVGGARTWLNHRISLVTFFKWTKERSGYPAGPTVAERSAKPILPGADPGILTPDELTRLLSVVSDQDLRVFIAIGAFAGLRPSEIERLRWRDIGADTIVLGREITKTKRRRVVPISANLREWLGHPQQVAMDMPVVGTRMHRKLQQACRAAGLQWKHNALRHSSISYSMALTKDAAAVAEAHGHSVSRLQESYKANVTEAAAREWFAIQP